MSDSLEEKVNYILEDSDFNNLPFEERKHIAKYMAQQQILTLYQVVNKDKAHTTEAWRKKTTAWLKNCVDTYYKEYRYPQVEQTEPQTCEECEHWSDSEDGCADRHGCKTEPLPKAINGVKIADAVAWADKWLEDNPISEMWDMIRTLRDATEWQTEPQTERYCTNCKHNGVLADYECRECHGMDKHEFIEPQTERSE